MNNFHLQVTDFNWAHTVNDSVNCRNDICLLFVGKLNWFGTQHWETHCLPWYKKIRKDFKGKISVRLLVWDLDITTSGGWANFLSGYGDVYPKLGLGNNWLEIDKNKTEQAKNIRDWLEQQTNQPKLDSKKFIAYCNKCFSFADEVKVYTINPNDVKKDFDTSEDFGYMWQHFQLTHALRLYPDMFDNLSNESSVIRTRYDVVMHDYVYNSPKNLGNLFYHMFTRQSGYANRFTGENMYNYPTVMFANLPTIPGQQQTTANTTLRELFLPNDVILWFNTQGIKTYAQTYDKWAISKVPVGNKFYTLPIHQGLGGFFLQNNYNTIDISPMGYTHELDGVLGSPLRYYYDDKYDDYRTRWYQGHRQILDKLLEKFSC